MVFKFFQRIQGQNPWHPKGLSYSIHLKQISVQKGERHCFVAALLHLNTLSQTEWMKLMGPDPKHLKLS